MKRFKHLFESPPDLLTPNPPSVTATEHGPKPEKKKKISEQHREEGRFKPVVPRYVKSKGVGPRPSIDSVKVKLKEELGKPTPSAEQVAKKHGVSVEEIEKQLKIGMKVEKEHTTDEKTAKEIALDHLSEKPDYYSKLKKYVEGVEPDSESIASRTYIEKPQKEPMKKYKTFKEDLRNWFNPSHPEGGWKRINSKGEAIGPCAREPGEAKPKCMSNEKRASLSKKERASAVRTKRKHDPNPERKGKPINVSNYGKGKLSEDMEQLDEKNQPTNPELWSRAKALARSKFDVYPSAYANGWAAKWYKSKGGGWKSVSEEVEQMHEEKDKREYDYEGEMVKSDLRSVIANANRLIEMLDDTTNLPEWCQNKITLAEDYVSTVANYMTAEMNESKENVHDAIKKIRKEDVDLQEGRASQRHPLEGHAYHKKSDAELKYIAKDAHEAAENMKGHNTTAENKYRDQVNDAHTVLHFRKTNGTPDWYKKKYGHMKEEVESVEEGYEGKGNHRPGWMLKADPKLAKKFKEIEDRHKALRKWAGKTVPQKDVKEEVEQIDELSTELLARYKSAAGKQERAADAAGNIKKGDKRFSGIMKATLKQFKNDAKKSVKEATEKPPFDGPYKKDTGTKTDKSGAQHSPYSRVRHLARMAAQKNMEKTKKPVKEDVEQVEEGLMNVAKKVKDTAKFHYQFAKKRLQNPDAPTSPEEKQQWRKIHKESLEESRKAEIVKEIVKKKKDAKNPKGGDETFQKEPVLGSEIVKT